MMMMILESNNCRSAYAARLHTILNVMPDYNVSTSNIHTHIHANVRTYIHTYLRNNLATSNIYIHTYIHTYVITLRHHIYMHIHTYIHTCIHTCIHACIHTCILTNLSYDLIAYVSQVVVYNVFLFIHHSPRQQLDHAIRFHIT